MDYSRRQEFSHFYGGQFRPYWSNKRPGQPPVLVVHVPIPVRMENRCCFDTDSHTEMLKSKSRAQRDRDFKRRQTFHEKKSACAILPFYGLDGQDFTNEIQNGTDEDNNLTTKPRETSLEWNTVCSFMPGSDLSDKEFRKLFFRPAGTQDLPEAVNNTLACSLKLADAKICALQKQMEKLKLEKESTQKHLSDEIEQSTETLAFHHFNNEMLRLKNADLEERVRQFREANKILSSACEHLVEDKEQLATVVQSCLENLDTYKRKKKDRTSSSTKGKVIAEQNDIQPQPSEDQTNCEWCPIVKAFYRVCQPT